MPLRDRAAFSEKVGADLFVSLHMNAHTNSSVKGTEVYYAKNNNSKNKAGLNSQMMAKFFLDNLLKTMGTKSRGVLDDRFTVIYRNTVPAVLVELGLCQIKKILPKSQMKNIKIKQPKQSMTPYYRYLSNILPVERGKTNETEAYLQKSD